jgi:hypothetical protein
MKGSVSAKRVVKSRALSAIILWDYRAIFDRCEKQEDFYERQMSRSS